MTRVLLTGGSGFIAAHVLEILLKNGHSVVTTVRSQEKAKAIQKAHSSYGKDKLDFAIVEDIAQPGAFDQAIKSDPPFEAVIHTASPFHFNVKDVKKDLLDPAVIGTTGILKAIKSSAPTVKRVVITSSFAAIVDGSKGLRPGYTYSEADWNPITEDQARENPINGYRASKTFAERAAWDFVSKEKPNFTLATINPTLVLGPVVHYLNSLDALNTSNEQIRDFMLGKFKTEIPATRMNTWVDVRDVALAHVRAMDIPDAGDKRFYLVTGYFSNREIRDSIAKAFPEYKDKLPGPDVAGGEAPKETFTFDNSRAKKVLDLEFRSFDESVADTVKSLQAVGA